MSRSGLDEDLDFDNWASIRWRGAVMSAIRGKKGQAVLVELLEALDALPEKKLVREELITEDGCVCALGALGKARGMDIGKFDPYDMESIWPALGLTEALAREIVWENDARMRETPEERFSRVRKWVESQIRKDAA